MKIEILRGYRGASTNGKYYPKGEYDLSEHSILSNIADYLIENGHAVMFPDSTHIENAHNPKTVTPEFTKQAQRFIDENELDIDELTTHFARRGVLKVGKSDVRDYADED